MSVSRTRDRAVIGVGRAVAIFLAVMVDDGELALLDELAKHFVEQPHVAGIPSFCAVSA